jgi:low affinity Fe/Cu permease
VRNGTWLCEEICGIIQTLVVYYTPILVWSTHDRIIAVGNASNDMVLEAKWALCEFYLLVMQQNHCNLSFNRLDNALRQNLSDTGHFLRTQNINVGEGPSG